MAESVDQLLDTAEEAARRAGRILAEKFEGVRTIEYKGGIDLVTDADRAAEDVILPLIAQRHPGHEVLSEESGFSSGAGCRWLVDPLDGTTNYSHQVPHFCVSIAVAQANEVLAGAVLDPIRGELFSAARGKGARLNGRAIRVSDCAELGRALMSTGFPYDVRENPQAPIGLFNRIIRRVQGVRRMGAAALDLAYVACGRFDGFFEFGLKPWDVAAGALLIQEAGGYLRRIDGGGLDLGQGDIIASTPGISERLQQECSEFLRDAGWQPRC